MLDTNTIEAIHLRIDAMIHLFANGNKSAFGRQAGIQSGVLAGILGGRLNKPSFEVLQRLLLAYPQVRMEWLLLGQGHMLKDEYNPQRLVDTLAEANSELRKTYELSNASEATEILIALRSIQDQLKELELVSEAIESGVYPSFNKSLVQEYRAVLGGITSHIRAIEDVEKDLKEGDSSISEQRQADPTIEPPIKGFIEVVDSQGRKSMIALTAIAYIQCSSSHINNTMIILTNRNAGEHISVEACASYESIKTSLIEAS